MPAPPADRPAPTPHPRAGPGLRWLGGAAVAVALAAAGPAWACFPLPVVSVQPGSSAPPGAELTVHGVDFGSGPVEVRWNALDGPQLGRATGPDFAVAVEVPQAPDGVYSLVVLNRNPDGSAGVKASTVVDVASGDGAGPAGGAGTAGTGAGGDTPRSTPAGALAGGGLALFALGGGAGVLVARRLRGATGG